MVSRDSQAIKVGEPAAYRTKASCSRRANGLTIFCVDLLEDIGVQISLGKELLQPAVLKLQGLQTLDVGRFHLAEVLAPGINGGVADLVLFGGLGHLRAICFAQDCDHLLF